MAEEKWQYAYAEYIEGKQGEYGPEMGVGIGIAFDPCNAFWWNEPPDESTEREWGFKHYNEHDSETIRTRLWYVLYNKMWKTPGDYWVLQSFGYEHGGERWEIVTADKAEEWFGHLSYSDCFLMTEGE